MAFRRVSILPSFLVVFALFGVAEAVAQSCTIQEKTTRFVGKNKQNDPYTFSTLESISSVVGIELKNSKNHYCDASSYVINANILTVKKNKGKDKKCKAKFTVEGKKKGCTDSTPANEIAQSPLFLAQNAEPNVMYLLDDSGSMQFELMPGEIIGGSARYIFPRANGIYGSSDYSNYVPTVANNSPYNARSRSPQVNTIYYDPSTTYSPWIKADGSRYPDANVKCAPHNPETSGSSNNLSNCRDLTSTNSNYNSNSWVNCNESGSCSRDSNTRNFWPATYFWYKGSGDMWSWSNYEKVEIRSGRSYSGHGRDERDDCADAENATCTYDEEIQNFANWYSYYRSRVSAARAGSGFAFAEQGANLRVGFGSLNSSSQSIDGVSTSVLRKGVRTFEGSDREAFFDELYGLTIPAAGTPLRNALNAAGKYYMRKDSKGPWSERPGTNDSTPDLECRRNYSVLVTDGYWSGSDVSGDPGKNNDGSNNPSHSSPTGNSYTYKAASPFSDSRDDTLADVAMYYWKNDLRNDLDNVVPVTKGNPAFWQHMVTFGVGLGVTGTIDPDTAFAAIESGASISWPNPTSADQHKIDDLLHAAVNSRGGFFSAADPGTFADELSDALQVIANEAKSSASAIAANSTRLDSGTLVYQASFNSLDWSGRMVAYKVNDDGTLGDVKWDSQKDSYGSVSSRKVFTAVGAPGALTTTAVDFSTSSWSLLDTTQRDALRNGGSIADGQLLLNWLRGDRSQEGKAFRSRGAILGDIVNSDPAFSGNLDDYGFHVLSGTEGSTYRTFLKSKKARPPFLVVGANDGMLHGFHADNGKELFSFMPAASYPAIAELADPDYQHRYYVDGSPRVSDAYLANKWRTVTVAAMGAGGRSVFAVDVTDPEAMSKNNFLWEFSTSSSDTDKLGVAMSAPAIARLAAGNQWVAVFGNGYNSGDNVKLFIVDLADGKLLKAIDTGVTGSGNGLASPVPVDVDGDRVTDFVYAGDLQGNLWKFDLRGSTANKWDVALKSGSKPAPLFTAVDDNGDPQPITSRPTVGNHQEGGYYVYFGTGKFFETGDAKVGNSPQLQDFYGIRDVDAAVSRSDLLVQDVIFEQVGVTKDGSNTPFQVRLVTNKAADDAPDYGWRLPLQPPNDSVEGERAVSRPILRNGRIVFTTLIPTDNICGFGGRSWLMELDAQTGGRYADPVLDTNGDGLINELDVVLYNGEYLPISGRGSNEIIKTPGIVGAGDIEYKFTSGSSGTIGIVVEKGDDNGIVGRQSWRQLQ
ncbi:PilC/PilY family type IV pilus protein [Spongiibacter sp.]|uniref:pilus assembly protein n=1 Tax=Spongiibacter sp. TaxID=2024860 RepID=UPI00257E2200|nr:PilC/PilY family type IV pilus protein [Spongiibacter sp.]